MVVNWSWNWKINFRYSALCSEHPFPSRLNGTAQNAQAFGPSSHTVYSYKQVQNAKNKQAATKNQRRQAAWNVFLINSCK